MPIPAHKRIIVTGRLTQADGGGEEIFDFGVASASGMTVQDLAAAVASRAHDFWSNAGQNFIPSNAILTGVRVEAIDDGGRVTNSYFAGVDQVSGGGSNLATILSSAVTLETDTPGGHGRMIRGRFYPPAYFQVNGATTTLPIASGWANSWAGLVNGMNDAGALVSVASTQNGGAIARVTAVTVDTIVDTVRRRKNHVTGQRSPRVSIPG